MPTVWRMTCHDRMKHPARRRWVVTGATGLIGPAFCREARRNGVEVLPTSRSGRLGSQGIDLSVRGSISAFLDAECPDAVFHLGAISRPAQVSLDVEAARAVNLHASEEIATWCGQNQRWLLFTSTDQVYDGESGPYREGDHARPATDYGALKLAAEKLVVEVGGLVARLGWVLNDSLIGRNDFIREATGRMVAGEAVRAVGDEFRTPIQLTDAVNILCSLAERRHTGIVNVAGRRHATPYDLLVEAAENGGLPADLVQRETRLNLSPPGRPRDLRLDTSLLASLMSQASLAEVRG